MLPAALVCWLASQLVLQWALGSVKFNQRIFLSVKAIHYVDPTKNGFRVILRDEFLRAHMAPTLLPTLYLTAIPLRQEAAEGQQAITRVFYPDSVNEEKQVQMEGLREAAWYYLCVEWENFNRHNETTGTDCRLFRTLDRLGKGADTTVSELEATDFSSQMLQFRMRAGADFPLRLSASLEGGRAPSPPAQVFQLGGRPADLELIFSFLRQQMDYGQLCVLEEPLVSGFTALGRLVSGVGMRKCHFSNLTTTDYELSILESAEASPYMRSAAAEPRRGTSLSLAILAVLLCLWRR